MEWLLNCLKGVSFYLFNISELLRKANFTHFEFDQADSKLFNQQYGSTTAKFSKALTNGEVSAIESYTGSGYLDMNCFLHGKLMVCDSKTLKDALIKSLFVASGLNKIMPDLIHSESFRGDSPDLAQVNERIDCVKNGGGTTDTPAFFSTSKSEYIAKGFSGTCIIHFDDRYGKDVSWISCFPSEEEYLLEPTKILWTKYEYINNKHVFHAQKVVPLTNDDKASKQDLQSFGKLFDWANKHGVNTNFITPWLKSTLNEARESENITSKVKSEAISLSDCITLDNNILDHHLGHNPGSQNATLNQAQDINALTLQIQHLELSPVHMEV